MKTESASQRGTWSLASGAPGSWAGKASTFTHPLLPEPGEQGCQKHTASQAPQKADAAFRVRLCPKQLPSLVLPSQPRRAIPVQPRSCVQLASDSPNLGTGGDLGESNPCQDKHFLGSLLFASCRGREAHYLARQLGSLDCPSQNPFLY